MKKTILLLLLILSANVFAFAKKSPLAELFQVRQIKLLYNTRADVRRILADYKSDSNVDDEDDFSDYFSNENVRIEVTYSSGNCSEDEDFWNAPKHTVASINVDFKDSPKLKKIGYNVSDFMKEQKYDKSFETFVYHNKSRGIAFEVDEGEVEWINYFPPANSRFKLCDNEDAREFYSKESWFRKKLEERTGEIVCHSANVENLILSTTELTAACETDFAKNENCAVGAMNILVLTTAVDGDNDPLTYQYTVSGGKIVGEGARVSWDVSGLKPGSYTITAAVDDGCGFCGMTRTETLTVK